MSDYRVRISVRNARLLRAIENAGHGPGEQFANAVGISYGVSLLSYLNLTRSPLTRDGLLRECAWALCDFLRVSPSDLWSDAQLQPLEKNHSSIDMDEHSVHALTRSTHNADDPLLLTCHVQAGSILQRAIDSLTPREAGVIRDRFFADLTLDDVAEKMKITRGRVLHIEQKALRKLRSESRIPRDMAGMADVIGGYADA